MMTNDRIELYLARYPSLPGLIYAAIVLMFGLVAVFLLLDIVEKYRARSTALEMIAKFENRASLSSPTSDDRAKSSQSPFLEGQTKTLASAALLQRISSAINGVDGTVVSTEIEPQGPQSTDRYLRAIAVCELPEAALQRLLYDLERGMPYLFIDQLLVQSSPASEGGRIQLRLGIVGMWPGTK